MPTRQQILDDVNSRYRNTFTPAQKLVWINDYEKTLFEIFEIDAPPYNFTTVADEEYYPIPSEIDIEKIKVISIETSDGEFQELPFKRNDDKQYVSESEYWYTIISDLFYINVPGGAVNDRNIYIYHDKKPTEWTTSNLSSEPDTPKRFQEILKLHLLEMIAGARKDVTMKNNYLADKEKMIDDFVWQMKMSEPEFIPAADINPKVRHGGRWWDYVERK
jgi:hypothetical protein